MSQRNYQPESPERVASALAFIDPTDREIWVKMAMATKAALGDIGFDIWSSWSEGADSFSATDARDVWRSAKETGGTGAATLFWHARNNGWKDDGSFQAPAALTAEQIAAREAQRAHAAAEEAARRGAAADLAKALRDAGSKEISDHPYIKRKGAGLKYGAGIRRGSFPQRGWDDALLVPIYGADRNVMSLEAISADGEKIGLKDGARSGGFYPVGQFMAAETNPSRIVIVAEGLATAAACQAATGYPAVVAFSVGNLRGAGETVKRMCPDARLVIAADLGAEAKARAAAIALGACLVVPHGEGLEDGNDFWDARDILGGKLVAAQFEEAIAAGPLEAEVVASEQALRPDAARQDAAVREQAAQASPVVHAEAEEIPDELAARLLPKFEERSAQPVTIQSASSVTTATSSEDPDFDKHFAVLGFDRSTIFVYSHSRTQVLTTSASALSKASGLIELAPLNWWEYYFQKAGKGGSGLDAAAAADWLVRLAEKRGIYDDSRVRGRGVWLDDGRLVFHHGNFLTVDGVQTELSNIRSRHVYEGAAAISSAADTRMTASEGAALTATACRFRWSHSGSGLLMAGWAFLAPVCGALNWRSHIWVTGAAGSGKSTLLDKFLAQLMPSDWLLSLQGSSTEAGVRQKLKGDARPVLIDEFECNTEADVKRIESILTLIRQSSSETGAEVARGTISGHAMSFRIRSAFCLASVGVSLSRQTDEDRLTRLELAAEAVGDWDTLERELEAIAADHTYGQRMFARALKMLPVIRESAAVISRVAGKHFGRQRDGDQFGTLLAGAWCLQKDKAPTEAEAKVLIEGQDWASLGAGASVQVNDSRQALDAILSSPVRVDQRTFSVAQLIEVAAGGAMAGTGSLPAFDQAVHSLGLHGIRISEGEDPRRLMFAMARRELVKLVEGTDFETDLIGRLARLPGAWKSKVKKPGEVGPPEKARFAGATSRYVSIPLSLCGSGEDVDATNDDHPF
ncbi:PriCT-2 domain-containing protein [Methylobacterium sp. 22177]|uniref:PriCT-2 domain-containing protein n=1 Tax=Methylobacterium sp. 22177 TaxID=3453885 RepID=UPI003F834693